MNQLASLLTGIPPQQGASPLLQGGVQQPVALQQAGTILPTDNVAPAFSELVSLQNTALLQQDLQNLTALTTEQQVALANQLSALNSQQSQNTANQATISLHQALQTLKNAGATLNTPTSETSIQTPQTTPSLANAAQTITATSQNLQPAVPQDEATAQATLTRPDNAPTPKLDPSLYVRKADLPATNNTANSQTDAASIITSITTQTGKATSQYSQAPGTNLAQQQLNTATQQQLNAAAKQLEAVKQAQSNPLVDIAKKTSIDAATQQTNGNSALVAALNTGIVGQKGKQPVATTQPAKLNSTTATIATQAQIAATQAQGAVDPTVTIQPTGQVFIDPTLDQPLQPVQSQPSHHPSPTEQVSVRIAQAVQKGDSRIDIQLEPARLGKVEVQIELNRDGRAMVTVLAERPETLELLRTDSRALEKALQDAGLKTDTNSLSFGHKENTSSFAQTKQGNQSYGQQIAGGLGSDSIGEEQLYLSYRSDKAIDISV